jgi:flagellar FliL protein
VLKSGYKVATVSGIMATSPVVVDVIDARGAGSNKPALMPLVLAVVGAVLLSVLLLGGIGYYLIRSGRLTLPAAGAPVVKVEPTVEPTTHAMMLEPMVVNLADVGGKTYLRVALTLRVVDAPAKKDAKAKEEAGKDAKGGNDAEAGVRDTALEVLGRQTATELLAADGKERLKSELKVAFAAHNAELKVADVFFTEFLVQQ